MSEFLNDPYTPERKIQTAFIGNAPRELKNWIESHNVRLIEIKNNPNLPTPLAGHAEIQIFHAGSGTFVCDEMQEQLFKVLKFAKASDLTIGSTYPDDCKLNFAVIGERVFGKQSCMDPTLQKICDQRGWKRIHVNQGYARCSTCILSFDNFITDDPSMHRTGIIERMDSLLIRKGDVKLDGFDYGFIGGASAKISNDEVLFFGDIRQHRDFDQIHAFLTRHHYTYEYFPDFPLTDIGGILPID